MYVLWGAKPDKIHKKNSLSRMIPKDCRLQLPQSYSVILLRCGSETLGRSTLRLYDLLGRLPVKAPAAITRRDAF